MNTTIQLIDAYKAKLGLATDAEAARALKLAPSSVSNYRQGVRQAEPRIVRKLAETVGMDVDVAMLRVHIEQEHEHRNKSAWTHLLRRIAGVAAVASITFALAHPPTAKDGQQDMANATIETVAPGETDAQDWTPDSATVGASPYTPWTDYAPDAAPGFEDLEDDPPEGDA